MYVGTRTLPYSDTRPTSLRPRSTSITCSARSFSLRLSSSASRTSSSSFRPRGRVPAIGCVSTRRPSTRTSISGDDPTIERPPTRRKVHVRRRIHVAKGAVDRERIGGERRLESLRQHDLIDVAGGNVFLGRAHHLLELGAADVRGHLEGGRIGRRRLGQRAIEIALDELDLGARELIQRLERLVAGDAGVGDDENAMAHVIEGQHRIEEHESGFLVDRRRRLQIHRLEPGRGVVAQIADGPAREARQAGHERRVESRHRLAHRRDEGLIRSPTSGRRDR